MTTKMTTRTIPITPAHAWLLLGAVTAASGAAPAPVDAQDAPAVVGRWEARWAAGIRTERDGSVTVRREADAVLVLEAAGDSLVGTWTFDLPGPGRSTWRVHGRLRDARLDLVATDHETEHDLPPGQGTVVRQEWSGTVSEKRIEGEHWMVIGLPDGREVRSGPRPWSAVGPRG